MSEEDEKRSGKSQGQVTETGTLQKIGRKKELKTSNLERDDYQALVRSANPLN